MRPAASTTVRTPAEQQTAVLALEPVHRRTDVSTIVLTSAHMLIGSGPECDARLPLAGIEPRHCSVDVVDGRTYLQSHAPRTWLNNAPLRRAILREGDRVAIGPWEFRTRRATTEELLHHLPDQPASVNTLPASSEQSSAPPRSSALNTLQALEQELRRELSHSIHSESETLQSVLEDVGRAAPTPPPLPPQAKPPQSDEAHDLVIESSGSTADDDREKLGSLLTNWEAEAETLRRELLAQAEVLNTEIKRQQEELHELQEETRRSAAKLAQEQQARQEFRGGRQQPDEVSAELQRREQELSERTSALEVARQTLAEERNRQELSWRQQQSELGATAQWWEQRRADFGRRQAHLAAVSDLLLDSERQLLDTARRQQSEYDQRVQFLQQERDRLQSEVLHREQHLSEWEQSLAIQNGLSSARLAEAERAAAARAVRELEFQERERNLSDRFAATEAREQHLSTHERELESVAADLDRRTQDLETRIAAFSRECVERQQAISARESEGENRGRLLIEREQTTVQERDRLDRERRELDEEVSRLHQLRRQIEVEREQFDSERTQLAEEQARFRDDCGRYLEAVEVLEEEQRLFALQVAAAKEAAPSTVSGQSDIDSKIKAEQVALDDLRAELEKSRAQIDSERVRLEEAERSLAEQTETLQSERESLLTERLAWDHERLQINEQRLKASNDQAELTAERDRLQSELHNLEANRSQLGAELDRLRDQQEELNSQYEHRHAEVSDWLQEHTEQSNSEPVRSGKDAEPPSTTNVSHVDPLTYGDRPEIDYRRAEPAAETSPGIYDWTRGLADSLGIRQPDQSDESSPEDLGHLHIESSQSSEPSHDDHPPSVRLDDLTTKTTDPSAKEGHVRSLLAEMFNIPLPGAAAGDVGKSSVEAEHPSSGSLDEYRSHATGRGTDSGDWHRERNREDELFRSSDIERHRDLSEPLAHESDKSQDRNRETLSSSYRELPVHDIPALQGMVPEHDALTHDDEPAARHEPAAYEPPAPAPIPPPAPAPSATDYTLQSTDPDSIAAYMERLLQRNRRRGVDDYEPSASVHSAPPRAVGQPVDLMPASLASPGELSADSSGHPGHESPVIENEPDLPARPRADAQEVRAGIDSLRQVANLSARTAVASHTWKRNRSLVALRAVLMLAASAVAGFLLLGPLAAEERFGMTGMAALFIAIVAGADFARAVWHIYLLNSLRRTSERNVIAGQTAQPEELDDQAS